MVTLVTCHSYPTIFYSSNGARYYWIYFKLSNSISFISTIQFTHIYIHIHFIQLQSNESSIPIIQTYLELLRWKLSTIRPLFLFPDLIPISTYLDLHIIKISLFNQLFIQFSPKHTLGLFYTFDPKLLHFYNLVLIT